MKFQFSIFWTILFLASIHGHVIEDIGKFIKNIDDGLKRNKYLFQVTNMVDPVNGNIHKPEQMENPFLLKFPPHLPFPPIPFLQPPPIFPKHPSTEKELEQERNKNPKTGSGVVNEPKVTKKHYQVLHINQGKIPNKNTKISQSYRSKLPESYLTQVSPHRVDSIRLSYNNFVKDADDRHKLNPSYNEARQNLAYLKQDYKEPDLKKGNLQVIKQKQTSLEKKKPIISRNSFHQNVDGDEYNSQLDAFDKGDQQRSVDITQNYNGSTSNSAYPQIPLAKKGLPHNENPTNSQASLNNNFQGNSENEPESGGNYHEPYQEFEHQQKNSNPEFLQPNQPVPLDRNVETPQVPRSYQTMPQNGHQAISQVPSDNAGLTSEKKPRYNEFYNNNQQKLQNLQQGLNNAGPMFEDSYFSKELPPKSDAEVDDASFFPNIPQKQALNKPLSYSENQLGQGQNEAGPNSDNSYFLRELQPGGDTGADSVSVFPKIPRTQTLIAPQQFNKPLTYPDNQGVSNQNQMPRNSMNVVQQSPSEARQKYNQIQKYSEHPSYLPEIRLSEPALHDGNPKTPPIPQLDQFGLHNANPATLQESQRSQAVPYNSNILKKLYTKNNGVIKNYNVPRPLYDDPEPYLVKISK